MLPRPESVLVRWSSRVAAVAAAALVGACDDVPPPTSTTGPLLEVVQAGVRTDTIEARPADPFVLRVYDEVGQLRAGVPITLQSESRRVALGVGGGGFAYALATVTNSSGEAEIDVLFGREAGVDTVVVTVGTLGLEQSFAYQVNAGNGTSVALSPPDTTAVINTVVEWNGFVADRYGNPTPEPVVFEALTLGVVATATGFEARAVSENEIRVGGMIADSTVWVQGRISVAPAGTVATSGIRGALDVYISDLAGKGQGVGGRAAIMPTWAPDGQHLAFVNGNQLYVTDLSGNETALNTGLASSTWPIYSADGWIYFLGDGSEGTEIYRLRPDGSELTKVTDEIDPVGPPALSPDGKALPYPRRRGAFMWDLAIRDLDTGAMQTVVTDNEVRYVAWSPDGEWLAYLSGQFGTLLFIRPDGSGHRVVGRHGLHPGYSFSPDSEWIIGIEQYPTLVDVSAFSMIDLTWSVVPYGISWKP